MVAYLLGTGIALALMAMTVLVTDDSLYQTGVTLAVLSIVAFGVSGVFFLFTQSPNCAQLFTGCA